MVFQVFRFICFTLTSLTYPEEVLDNVAYRIARSIVGLRVLCHGFSHDMSDNCMAGRRAAVDFGPACR